MEAWIATLLICVLIPALMLAVGTFFKRGGPKQINYIHGYRTHRSMLNEDTWRFAHRYCGRIWFVAGLVLLPLSAVAVACLWGQPDATLGTAAAIICAVQVAVLIFGTVIPTEIALNRTFDRDGNRK